MKTVEAAISSQSEGVKSLMTGGFKNFRTGAITDLREWGTFVGGVNTPLHAMFKAHCILLSLKKENCLYQESL